MIAAKTSVSGPVEEVFRKEKVGCLCPGGAVTVFPETTLQETLDLLRGDSGGCVVVVKARELQDKRRKKLKGAVDRRGGGESLKPVGIFTERDYLDKIVRIGQQTPNQPPASPNQPPAASPNLPISKFMTPDPKTLSQEESLDTALELMTRGGYRHLPLVDAEGSLVGVLSARNIISFLAEFFPVEIINLPPRHDQKIGSREGG